MVVELSGMMIIYNYNDNEIMTEESEKTEKNTVN